VDGGVPLGPTRGPLHREIDAEDLVDRVRPQRRVLGEKPTLLWMVEQEGGPVPDEIDGGLEPRADDQRGRGPQTV
jgi:hypothetical protein